MVAYVFAVIFFGFVPWFLLWRLLFTFLAPKAGQQDDHLPPILASAVSLPLCAWACRQLAREIKKRNGRKTPAGDQQIEEWRIQSSRVLELIPLGDDDPVLCFEAGPDRVVMLKGQWLRDEPIYGAPPIRDDPDENFLNGLGRPYSFPCRKFTVVRWPDSGDVLAIKCYGDYLAPEPSKVTIKRNYYFKSSECFNGALEHLEQLLEQASKKQG